MSRNTFDYFNRLIMYILVLIICVLSYLSCSGNNQKEEIKCIGFDFDKPDKIIPLPASLKEISGIAYYGKDKIICQQDEHANSYIVDIQKGTIDYEFKTNIYGDFEDIAYIGNAIYILKNNGTIYKYTDSSYEVGVFEKYTTELNAKNDAEGLAYDNKTNSLLIACKSSPYIKTVSSGAENIRNVYQFDLKTNSLVLNPFLTINLNDLKKRFGFEKFMPSGIAIHPVTNNYYILSAVGNVILLVGTDKQLICAQKLKKSLFQQPEGICFDPEGKTLFISNEGKNGIANLMIFKSK